MKIRVPLVIDVDPQKWADSNGEILGVDDYTIASMRDDIRSYVLTAIQGTAMIDETGAEVTL